MKTVNYNSDICKRCNYLSLKSLCQDSQCPMDGRNPCPVCLNCSICKIAAKVFEEKQKNKK